jgi:hypothetical protein
MHTPLRWMLPFGALLISISAIALLAPRDLIGLPTLNPAVVHILLIAGLFTVGLTMLGIYFAVHMVTSRIRPSEVALRAGWDLRGKYEAKIRKLGAAPLIPRDAPIERLLGWAVGDDE